ncbi:MAG: single-stranded DNA-binding protein [Patescibacteria group bacterium]|nr:single-stranded DNA-binding protein [Patescibacteria group bacterium]
MARSLNQVILLGNVGRDAEVRQAGSSSVVEFPVATTRRWKDQASGEFKEETDWHRIVLWRGDAIAQYLTKGSRVCVTGRIRNRSFDDKDGNKKFVTEIIADDVVLCDRPAGKDGGVNKPQDNAPNLDDVPF